MESKESVPQSCDCGERKDNVVCNSAKNSSIKSIKPKNQPFKRNAIPDEILNNELLIQAISVLPSNYNFEIFKTIHTIRQVRMNF